MTPPKAKPNKEKIAVAKEFAKLIAEYPIIGAINMENLPTKQLQQMRTSLRGTVLMKMTKRRIVQIAIEQSKDSKKDIEKLIPYLKGMPALLFTRENPFKLYNIINKKKSTAPAKAGQTAPRDIVVKEGPTPFAPGPIIGELGQAGIKAGIDGGKVVIKADSVVVKEGEVIKPNIAAILSRLGIEPMEIGLDITAVYENGTIYTKEVLAVDEKEYFAKIADAAVSCINLAVEVGFLTAETTEMMIVKAFNESKALALEVNFMADAVKGDVLAKAEREAAAVKAEAKLE